jgi:hypothetical protein
MYIFQCSRKSLDGLETEVIQNFSIHNLILSIWCQI